MLAWFIAPAPGKPLILYFHGNANGLADRGARFRKLTETGDGLLGVEYRGYPGSTGSPSEEGLLRDGEATYAKALELGFPADGIVAMGESLGTGVAVDLAARHPVAALVLELAFFGDGRCGGRALLDVSCPAFDARSVSLRREDRQSLRAGADGPRNGRSHDRHRLCRKTVRAGQRTQNFMRVSGAGHLALGEVIPQVLLWIDRTMPPAKP